MKDGEPRFPPEKAATYQIKYPAESASHKYPAAGGISHQKYPAARRNQLPNVSGDRRLVLRCLAICCIVYSLCGVLVVNPPLSDI